MTIVGAQDFQSGEQWQSKVILSDSHFLLAGANYTWPDTGPATIAVANWQGTQVKVNAASAADWTFRWWADAAGTFQVGSRRFTTSTVFTDTYLTLSNLGPYLTINALNGAAGNNTASFSIIGTNRILAPFQPDSSAPMIATGVTTVGAGVTTTTLASYLYAGPAAAWVFTDAAAFAVNLQCLTSAGTITLVNNWNQTGFTVGQIRNVTVTLPPRPARVEFINADGVARSFGFALTPDIFR